MTTFEYERVRCVHGNLFAYKKHKQAIDDFVAKAMRQSGKRWDSAGGRGSFRSDPAARGGMLLADPPPRIKSALDWCCAIEDAWAECRMLDDGNERGLAYLMEENFCLTGDDHTRDCNREARMRICVACEISESTFYAWLHRVTNIVCYHAAQRGLI